MPDGERRGSEFGSRTQKKEALAAEGISKTAAHENEKLAQLKASGDLAKLIAKGAPTAAAALALEKLAESQRKRVLRSGGARRARARRAGTSSRPCHGNRFPSGGNRPGTSSRPHCGILVYRP